MRYDKLALEDSTSIYEGTKLMQHQPLSEQGHG